MALARHSSQTEPAWTPRQREVLQLLVRGRTNGQIAEELGISLDGAKWHVSEIITKLGVDSREEAAEYWRHRNGLRLRFTRVLQSLTPAPIWAKVAGVSAVIAVAGFAAAAITIMVQGGNEDARPAAGTPPAVATGAATPDPATPGTAPSGATPEVIDGVTVRPLTVGPDMPLPRGMVVYYNVVGYATDSGATDPIRVYRDANGALVRDHLFANLPKVGGVFTMAADYERQELAVGVCTHGYCGGVAAADADSTAVLYRSNDGGVTWTAAGPLGRGVFLAAVTGDGVIGATYSEAAYSFAVLPGGTALSAPSPKSYPFALGGGEWGWYDATTGRLLSSDGQRVLWQRTPASGQAGGMVTSSAGDILVTQWSGSTNQPYDVKPWNNYIGTAATGQLYNALRYPGNADIRVVRPISRGALIANVGIDAAGGFAAGIPLHYHVAVIDLGTAQVHTIPEVSDGLSGFANGKNEHAFVAGAMVGNFLRVKTGGDCLNVRASADTGAKSLGCFKDGVLLRHADESDPVGGWYQVSTPAGVPGWASAEFLAP